MADPSPTTRISPLSEPDYRAAVRPLFDALGYAIDTHNLEQRILDLRARDGEVLVAGRVRESDSPRRSVIADGVSVHSLAICC